ncbi:hypothetical protein [Flavivirga spongiicola]|uniref:Extracellular endo-alpha-(1->5)-L-arabinanase C-terminal domain-containing protein n=1 Tax=Flavivirga spongiicola TaxID=421621 RepID=A0ABU7XXK4_9FLAO|nr:hypothetical protein [Flavivirga sp. MEBiC05379]MDO5980526.1 hypothetical protein [Flavivirga sp. MEBiC05379]
MKKQFVATTILVLFVIFVAKSQNTVNDFLGTWEYVCDGAEYGYTNGELKIEKKENNITTTVIFTDGRKLVADTTKLKKGILHFDLYIEGAIINISLKNTKGTLKGEVTIPDNPKLGLIANKKKK